MNTDGWDPAQYDRFRDERRQPFEDLLSLVRPVGGGRAVDLGCGTGELTSVLHCRLQTSETVGIDQSPAMLARAAAVDVPGVRFEQGDIARFPADGHWRYDLVFANASLHWVPGHHALIERLTAALADGGQLAFQVPANGDHPSHRVAAAIASESPFAELLVDAPAEHMHNILLPEEYASLLDRLGYRDQRVRLQVYGHHLASSADVVEWVKGTLLTPYRERLDPSVYEQFVARYRERLLDELGQQTPYFYPFKRILVWGRCP